MTRHDRADKVRFVDRLKGAMLKPAEPGNEQPAPAPSTVEQLEADVKANDKERIIGLIAAPFAAAIGFLITNVLISHDPAAHLKDGLVNQLHVSVSLYHEVLIALLVLAVVMELTAWFRKRLYLGIVMGLYGLTVFNLRYWGFGVPYLLCAGYLLVRAYRAQRALREATGQPSRGLGPPRRGRDVAYSPPRVNRRYTPPASRSRS